jgi:hypothetical protein
MIANPSFEPLATSQQARGCGAEWDPERRRNGRQRKPLQLVQDEYGALLARKTLEGAIELGATLLLRECLLRIVTGLHGFIDVLGCRNFS